MENQRNVGTAEYKLLAKCELRYYLAYLNRLSDRVISSNRSIDELLTDEINIIRLRSEIIKALQWK
jgi:hypothetical protein